MSKKIWQDSPHFKGMQWRNGMHNYMTHKGRVLQVRHVATGTEGFTASDSATADFHRGIWGALYYIMGTQFLESIGYSEPKIEA